MYKRLRKGKRLSIIVIILSMLVITLMACSSSEGSSENKQESSEGSEKDDGTLKIVSVHSVKELGYPPKVRGTYEIVAMQPVYETLAKFNESGEAVPWLAESWEVNSDENALTLKLKEGIKFHDDTDFNAESVKWNIEKFAEEGRFEAASVDSVEVVDEYTVQINLKSWDHSIQDNLFGFMGMASPTAYDKNGEDWLRDNPVGTGPFLMEEWVMDEKVTYTKNNNYWQEGKPYLDGIELHTIPETATIEDTMVNGDFDLYLYASPKSANDLSENFEIEMFESAFMTSGYALSPDSENSDSPFANEKVRKAFAHAIDKQAIVETVFYGYGIPVNQYAIEGHKTHNPSVQGTQYDPDKARELLVESGYPDGFKTQITYIQDPDNQQMYTAIQGYLAEVGVDVELNPVQSAAWTEMTASEGTWDGLIHTTFRTSNDVIFDFNRSMVSDSSHYRDTYLDEEAEALIKEVATLRDPVEYMKETHKLQKMIFDDYLTTIPLHVTGGVLVQTGEVQEHGLLKTQYTTWTPESVHLDK